MPSGRRRKKSSKGTSIEERDGALEPLSVSRREFEEREKLEEDSNGGKQEATDSSGSPSTGRAKETEADDGSENDADASGTNKKTDKPSSSRKRKGKKTKRSVSTMSIADNAAGSSSKESSTPKEEDADDGADTPRHRHRRSSHSRKRDQDKTKADDDDNDASNDASNDDDDDASNEETHTKSKAKGKAKDHSSGGDGKQNAKAESGTATNQGLVLAPEIVDMADTLRLDVMDTLVKLSAAQSAVTMSEWQVGSRKRIFKEEVRMLREVKGAEALGNMLMKGAMSDVWTDEHSSEAIKLLGIVASQGNVHNVKLLQKKWMVAYFVRALAHRDSSVQAACAAALVQLSGSVPQARHEIASEAPWRLLLQALTQQPSTSKYAAEAATVSNTKANATAEDAATLTAETAKEKTQEGNSTNRLASSTKGGELLVEVMSRQRRSGTLCGYEGNVDEAPGGAVEVLDKMLQSSLENNCSKVLRRVVGDSDANKEAFTESGGVLPILRYILYSPDDATVFELVTMVSHLSRSKMSARVILRESGADVLLARILKDLSAGKMVTRCLDALVRLSTLSTASNAGVATAGTSMGSRAGNAGSDRSGDMDDEATAKKRPSWGSLRESGAMIGGGVGGGGPGAGGGPGSGADAATGGGNAITTGFVVGGATSGVMDGVDCVVSGRLSAIEVALTVLEQCPDPAAKKYAVTFIGRLLLLTFSSSKHAITLRARNRALLLFAEADPDVSRISPWLTAYYKVENRQLEKEATVLFASIACISDDAKKRVLSLDGLPDSAKGDITAKLRAFGR